MSAVRSIETMQVCETGEVGETGLAGRRAWITLALLSGLYFVSFVDRVILALLVQPLKADLGVSDVQLGVLFGPAFAIFYAMVGLPIARLADRGNRIRLIVVGAVAWGLCTIASGLVSRYALLVALRIGLAVGEAALTPAAYSLIGSLFPARLRVRAASLYSATGVAGGAGAYIVGAAIIHAIGIRTLALPAPGPSLNPWQLAMVVVGLPAVLGAFAVALVGREPVGIGTRATPLADVWVHLRAHARMYAPLFLGAGIIQAANAAFAAWGPEYLRRDLGLPIREAGLWFGVSGLAGAVVGVLFVPALGRRWQARGRWDAIALMALATAAIGAVAAAVGPLSGRAGDFFAWNAVAAFGLYGSSTGLVVAMQDIAPLRMRATLVALLILSITLFGQGLGPPAVALASERLAHGRLGGPLALVAVGAVIPGLLLLLMARAPLSAYLRGSTRP